MVINLQKRGESPPNATFVMLCGDEIGAVVADLGANLCRFGSAGQDSPPHICRSNVAIDNKGGIVVGDSALRSVRENIEVQSLFNNDDINWNATEAMLEYGIQNCLRNPDLSCPLMLAENYFNTAERKEKVIEQNLRNALTHMQLYELLFEKMKLPAAYTCHNATLASFCSARPTSLIIDLGGREVRIVPVVDGFSLNRAIIRTSRGGNAMDGCLQGILQTRLSRKREVDGYNVALRPWFLCGNRACPPGLTESFVQMHQSDIIRDVKHWMSFIPHGQSGDRTGESSVEGIVGLIPPYELPDGTVVTPDEELCLCLEKQLFPQQSSLAQSKISRVRRGCSTDVNDEDPLHRLVLQAVDKCDVDVRKELLANVVLVGGGALVDGLAQRLSNELPKMVPANVKVKVVTSMSTLEKHHAAWIGGSILSICGSFQQLWISRDEYDEHGPRIYKQKCQH